MADVSGPLTTLNNVLPSGVDAGRIAQWHLREGVSYSDFRATVASAFNALNMEIFNAWGDLIYVTEEDTMEYPTGGTTGEMPELTEMDLAELVKGETTGHMLDLKPYGDGIGGSWRAFEDMRQRTLSASIRQIVERGRNRFERAVLTRCLTNTVNTLGTNGKDVGFCDGSGGGVTFAPPAQGGEIFDTSHDHYIGIASASKTFSDLLEEIAEHLLEHGHMAPFTVKVSTADVGSYKALTDFIKPIGDNIVVVDQGGSTSNRFFERGQVEAPGMSGSGIYVGSYSSARGVMRLYATSRIPTGYAFGYKSYGANNAKNPIAVRVRPSLGFGFFINEIASENDRFPIARIQIELEFGIGVAEDRTNGAAAYRVSGGSWANATIS